MLVRRLLAATVVVPLLLVAGCSDEEPEPVMPTTSSPTTSPSSTPTVDPLAIPAEAKKPTKAGAEALIRHFWDMVNHLVETGDAGPVRKLYGRDCDFCEGGVAFYESVLQQGHTIEGGKESVVRIRADLLSSLKGVKDVYAEVTVESTAQVERDPKGKVVNKFAGGSSVKEFYLSYENGQWGITNVEDAEG